MRNQFEFAILNDIFFRPLQETTISRCWYVYAQIRDAEKIETINEIQSILSDFVMDRKI